MDNQPEFAAYLHNPWAYPSKEEAAAIFCFKRAGRFVEGYDIDQELTELLTLYFGDLNKLHQLGLIYHYNKLKDHVIENNLIGLILYGTNIDDNLNKIINVYNTQNNKQIDLKIKTICIYLIKEYIKKENVKELCIKTPNFEIYYNK